MIPFPDRKYQVIVVDPPWPVKKVARRIRPNQVSMDYPTMTLEQIGELPVGNLAADESWCFLWTIQKFLFDAKPVLEGWGFHHLLTMVWQKTYGRSAGMPLFGFQWNCEFILVGYKGKPDMYPRRKLIPAAFPAENIRHSQKPAEFYQRIRVLGENRIDLFARWRHDGFEAWGDEV